jgi:ABC-type nickel/cobalt efflux system permease component RcnA
MRDKALFQSNFNSILNKSDFMRSSNLKMRNKITLIFSLLFVAVASAGAHPLGNFTINNYSRIEVEKKQIRARAVLDMAEIPTFQESQRIDADKDKTLSDAELNAYLENLTPEYIANLRLFVDEQPVQIQTAAKNISLPQGEAGLPTLRIEWDFVAEIPETAAADAIRRLRFENANFKERIGWNEIVVNRATGVNVFDSSAFGSGVTDELRTYPDDMLSAPLAEREAELSFAVGAVPATAKTLQNRNGSASAPVQKDKFAELISVRNITPAIVLFSLLVAFGLGAMHAMSPGHGKTVVGAYLVGSRGTVKHAAFLGLTVTITHTLGVFALGLIMLFASNYILPEKIMPFLSFVSGLLVFFIGVTLFKDRLFTALGWQAQGGHHHHQHDAAHHHPHQSGHSHEHHNHGDHGHHHHDGEHEHHSHAEHSHEEAHAHHHPHDAFTHTHDGHTHSHLPPEDISWKSLLGLGISGGLLPCPSALVLMLSAINLGRVGYGLILTLVFSLGLAATLTAVGLIFLDGGKALGSSPRLAGNRLVKTIPVFSAFVIACVGALICYNSLI